MISWYLLVFCIGLNIDKSILIRNLLFHIENRKIFIIISQILIILFFHLLRNFIIIESLNSLDSLCSRIASIK